MKVFLGVSIIVVFTLFLFSCAMSVPITMESPANNKTYQVDYLFEHDGCKVYRFFDHGEYVYFTNCTGEVSVMKGDSTDTRVINMVKSTRP